MSIQVEGTRTVLRADPANIEHIALVGEELNKSKIAGVIHLAALKLVLKSIQNEELRLENIHESFQNNKEVCLAALKNDPLQWIWMDDSFAKDKDFILEAIKFGAWELLDYAHDSIREEVEFKAKEQDAEYHGECKNGKRHGKGVLTFNSHKRYEGEFKNGVRTGKGTLLCSAYTFKGEFLDGLPHGQGIISYTDGSKLEGTFEKGKVIGAVTFTESDGKRTVGKYEDGNAPEIS